MNAAFRNQLEREAFGVRLGLSAGHARSLAALGGPAEVQDFVAALPVNYDDAGGLLSVSRSLDLQRAQCLEGALIAACALWMAGHTPWVVVLKAEDGEDHAIAPFLVDGHWGAISKTNHVWLRWRDPVYQSLRELVMSYFHEYTTDEPAAGGAWVSSKTLRAYTPLFDLSTLDSSRWVTGPQDCAEVDRLLHDIGHYPLLSQAQLDRLRPREPIETAAGRLRQFDGSGALLQFTVAACASPSAPAGGAAALG